MRRRPVRPLSASRAPVAPHSPARTPPRGPEAPAPKPIRETACRSAGRQSPTPAPPQEPGPARDSPGRSRELCGSSLADLPELDGGKAPPARRAGPDVPLRGRLRERILPRAHGKRPWTAGQDLVVSAEQHAPSAGAHPYFGLLVSRQQLHPQDLVGPFPRRAAVAQVGAQVAGRLLPAPRLLLRVRLRVILSPQRNHRGSPLLRPGTLDPAVDLTELHRERTVLHSGPGRSPDRQ